MPIVWVVFFNLIYGVSYAQAPPFISADLPEKEGFMRYEAFPKAAPFGDEIWVNEVPLKEFLKETTSMKFWDIFDEDSWVYLSSGSCIQRYKNARGYEYWKYPKGMRLVHRLYARTSPQRPFELRLIEKLGEEPDARWLFASYVPVNSSSMEFKRFEPSQADFKNLREAAFEIPALPKPLQIRLKRVHPHTCQTCHDMRSQSNFLKGTKRVAGPCGFIPSQSSSGKWAESLQKWVEEYKNGHGSGPFCGEVLNIP
ncbi:MAG: hypothetical protein HY400_01075 [Elusimicrobia bacterium]|nr:hypothetical protein [Elusimicrobiota bacterium]